MAARAVVKQAIGNPPSGKNVKSTLRGTDPDMPLPPGTRNGVSAKYLAPFEGDYECLSPDKLALFLVDGKPVDTKGRTRLTAGSHTIIAVAMPHSFAESE